MTVSTEIDSEQYTGNGVTTTFPYRFRILQASNMVVTRIDLSDVETVLVLGTDYTITGAGGYSGGNVILSTPLTNGYGLTLVRDLPITQETDLRNQGTFFAEVHEDAFDKLTMLIQQVWSWFGLALRRNTPLSKFYDAKGYRIGNLANPVNPQDAATKNYVDTQESSNLSKTLRVPESFIPQLPNAASRANKVLTFDPSGNAVATIPTSGSAADVLITLAQPPGAGMIGITGGGTVQDVIDGTKQVTYRGYTVKDRLDEVISVTAIPGVKGDGVTDDQPAIQAFVSAMTHGALYFPGGHTYLFKSTLTLTANNLFVFGDKGYVGDYSTKIKCGVANMDAFKFAGTGYRVEHISVIGFEVLDDSVAFGQTTTCTAFNFSMANGAKDIDSEISHCLAQHCKRGVYAIGANLKVQSCIFTSTLLPIYLDQITTPTAQESRGFQVTDCRFHHLGGTGGVVSTTTYPELLTSSCVTLISTQSRGNVIESNFADAQIRTFFSGQLGKASSLSYNNILRAEGDIFVVNNTTLVGGGNASDNFKCHGNIVVSDIGSGTNPQQYWHGYLCLFTNVYGSSIMDNLTSSARKGGIKLVNSSDNVIENTSCYNINGYYTSDGAIYSGVEMDSTSNNNVVVNTLVRQSIAPLSAKCVISNNGQNNYIGYFKGVNVTAQWVESSTAITTGILDGRLTGRKEVFSDLAPTTGTWRRGDISWINSVSAGGYEKWVCVTAGTPGTWKRSGLIES